MEKINLEENDIFYCREDDGFLLGYLQEQPDFLTKGLTWHELKENLKDIYNDITGGLVPNV